MSKVLSILLIEDNLALAKQICRFLEGIGWTIDFADKGKQGIALATANQYDVIILDLNLPDCDGLEVCGQIKQHQQKITPILMLTARDAFEDKAKGFKQGTDDYLTKPCDLRELAMRCEALSRRPQLHHPTVVKKGYLELEERAHSVRWHGKLVKTTKIGFKILHALAMAYPYPVTRSDLMSAVWKGEPPESNALKAHMYNVRKSLEQVSDTPLLTTISNVGYKLQGLEDNV
ncbi:MAG: response regulator transcription factor [Alteromonadaceae bacterium]|nr:response regulator transcription factor [Alteromonadaceae bacterium]